MPAEGPLLRHARRAVIRARIQTKALVFNVKLIIIGSGGGASSGAQQWQCNAVAELAPLRWQSSCCSHGGLSLYTWAVGAVGAVYTMQC